ncbi:MAG: hypothetical protein MI922_16700, partial [Bacteroidales bacterium]|nr:hypothetical protein [Bacteroidales bacterium]
MKFKLKKTALICMSMMIVAVGCDKEMEDPLKTSPNSLETEEIAIDPDIEVIPLPDDVNVPENGYTDEELAAQGWEILSVYDAKQSANPADESNLKAKKRIQRKKPNMQGLVNMGYKYKTLWDASYNNSRPKTTADGYNINGQHIGKGTGKTNLAKKFGWWLYADMYSPNTQFQKAYKSGWKDVHGTNTQVRNRSNTYKQCPWGQVVHTKSISETVSFTVEATGGLSWSTGINVKVFNLGVTSSISLKAGATTSKSANETVTHKSDAFRMKPKTAYQIKLQYKTAKQKIVHKYPV